LKSNLDSPRDVWHRWINAFVSSQNQFFHSDAEPRMKREFAILLVGWLVLAGFLFSLGRENLAVPGLYYDEAVCAGMARDFLEGKAPGHHFPGVASTEILGAPFPVFELPYCGALKSWLLIPAFKIFGSTQMVLRGADLFFCATALFFCMLWTWRLLGLNEALLAGLLLALDPAYFFSGALDWGPVLPSFLCRFAGFFLVLLAWRRQRARWALLAGFVLGLGFFNKIDFGVLLAGTAAAAAFAYGRLLKPLFNERRILILLGALGFTIGGGLMFLRLPFILLSIFSNGSPNPPGQLGEMAEKLHTLRAMYDGSYFYRLMDVGGVFDKMYQVPSPAWTPFGIVAVIAALILAGDVIFSAKENPARRTKLFLLLAGAFVTLGVLILPGAVRIHHTTLVYPFPHLIIAAAAVVLWNRPWKNFRLPRIAVGLFAGALILLAACELSATARTERLIRETGGRGLWSNALMKFAEEIKRRPGLVLCSLDWGFNEQLEFLTDGPQLEEAFWRTVPGVRIELPRDTNHIYLAHPPEFSLSPLGAQFMESVARENKNAVVQPWRDRQGRVVFYAISFPAP
jgi:Dolichyl-phosphate-mannose-protein mannosyltransferase